MNNDKCPKCGAKSTIDSKESKAERFFYDKPCVHCGCDSFVRDFEENKLWECYKCHEPLSVDDSHAFEVHRTRNIIDREKIEPLRRENRRLHEFCSEFVWLENTEEGVTWADKMRKENTELKATVDELPSKETILWALGANAMLDGLLPDANPKWHKKHCRCDPDVGASPCEYCATWDALKGLYDTQAAAEAGKEGNDG